jgi:hypothetical protein
MPTRYVPFCVDSSMEGAHTVSPRPDGFCGRGACCVGSKRFNISMGKLVYLNVGSHLVRNNGTLNVIVEQVGSSGNVTNVYFGGA